MWNNFVFPPFRTDFENRAKILIPIFSISFLSFVDDDLFISQGLWKNQTLHFFIVITLSLLSLINLVLWLNLGNLKFFHFSRLTRIFNPLPLELSLLEGPLFQQRNIWRHLSFFFYRKLFFCQHICFYSNKALSTIKEMKMLENFTWGLSSHHKQLLYRTYVPLIVFYGFSLWHIKNAPLSHFLMKLRKIQ